MLGEIVGNYRITDQLGAGGMGAVYQAEHVLLGKQAAIKVLLPERSVNKEMVDRFFNEARASSSVRHPGIVEIFDYGHLENGNAYLVMELLEGESLGARVRGGELMSPAAAVSIVRQVAGVLSAAHAHGIVHRDLKPDNVFLVPDPLLPRGERVKVLDFGIAKLAGSTDSGLVHTESGQVMGTPVYMSPEQCRGSGGVDHRSDLYALGCVFYQMLAGRPPFLASGSGEVLAAHIHLKPPAPSVYEPSVPAPVEEVVMKLLEKLPEDRYPSMDDLVADLNKVAAYLRSDDAPEPSLAASSKFRATSGPTALQEAPTTLRSTAGELAEASGRRRGRALWIVSGLAAVSAVALGAVVLFGGSEAGGEAAQTAPPERAGAAPAAEQPEAEEAEEAEEERRVEPAREPLVRELDPEALAEDGTTVTIRIESTPPGARVFRAGDGVRLGRTPIEVGATRGAGRGVFILRKTGYRSERIAIPVDRDQERQVALAPREPAGAKPTEASEEAPDEKREAESEEQPEEEPKEELDEEPDERPDEQLPGEDEAIDPFSLEEEP